MLKLNLNGRHAFRPVLLTPRQIVYLITLAELEFVKCHRNGKGDGKRAEIMEQCVDVLRAAVGVEEGVS